MVPFISLRKPQDCWRLPIKSPYFDSVWITPSSSTRSWFSPTIGVNPPNCQTNHRNMNDPQTFRTCSPKKCQFPPPRFPCRRQQQGTTSRGSNTANRRLLMGSKSSLQHSWFSHQNTGDLWEFIPPSWWFLSDWFRLGNQMEKIKTKKPMGVSKNAGYQLAQNILLFNLMFETSWDLEYPF